MAGTASPTPLLPGPLLPASDFPTPDSACPWMALVTAQPPLPGLPSSQPPPSGRAQLSRGIGLFCMSLCSPSANGRWLQHSDEAAGFGVRLTGSESQLSHFLLGEAWANCPL